MVEKEIQLSTLFGRCDGGYQKMIYSNQAVTTSDLVFIPMTPSCSSSSPSPYFPGIQEPGAYSTR